MKNSIAAAMTAMSDEETACLSPGIQFDDKDLGPEERQLEATRQIIWEKLVARLGSELLRREAENAAWSEKWRTRQDLNL